MKSVKLVLRLVAQLSLNPDFHGELCSSRIMQRLHDIDADGHADFNPDEILSNIAGRCT